MKTRTWLVAYMGVELFTLAEWTGKTDRQKEADMVKAVKEHEELQAHGDGTMHKLTMTKKGPVFSEFSGGFLDNIRNLVDKKRKARK